jgi:hypothetical protein
MIAEPANGSTPWHQTDWPTLNEIARELRCPVDELRGPLMNQRVYAGPEDRLPVAQVVAALEAEIAAGRWFPVRRLYHHTPRRARAV